MSEKDNKIRFTLRFSKMGKEKDIYDKLESYSKKEKKSKQQFIIDLLDNYFNSDNSIYKKSNNDSKKQLDFDNRNNFVNEVLIMVVKKSKEKKIKTKSKEWWSKNKIRKKHSYLKNKKKLTKKKLEEFESIEELRNMITDCISGLEISKEEIENIFSKYNGLIEL
jgi:hypothetical protein